MKSRVFPALAVLGGGLLLVLAVPRPSSGQYQNPDLPPELTALVNDLKVQTEQLAQNQKVIDGQLAKIAESVRQARLYAARGGKSNMLK